MKNKKLNFLLLGILLFLIITLTPKKVEAKSYSIENMDIQATINNNGSVTISQTLIYKFNGDYNGIYINIPINAKEIDDSNLLKKGRIDDSIYEGKSIKVNAVSSLEQNGKLIYEKTTENRAKNGITGYYTTSDSKSEQKIKLYRKSKDDEVTFNINYTIEDLCVKHNDVGELFYNFIGGAWEVTIKDLNIDIYLPNNKDEIKIWGHGPYEGVSKIIDRTHANFKVSNIKSGQYVAARIMFNKDNISESTKISNINATELILNDEKEIFENKEAKKSYTYKILIAATCLLIYWIILILVYEKDKKYPVINIDEDRLFEKYNPMIAGCIQGSRTILARDIIAVILNLIDKKIINLEFLSTTTLDKKENYYYIISKNAEKESEMDNIERFVYNWVFESKDKVHLNERLKEMPKEKQANKKFKELNEIVEEQLNKYGANKASVPMLLRGFNIFLFALSLVLIYKHIMFNGFSIYNDKIVNSSLVYLFKYILMASPLILGLLYIPLNLIIMIRHKITKKVQRYTGQKIATTTISLVVLFVAIIVITAFITTQRYVIADEILICIATIIILTDNLMLKNNAIMIEDFSKLNALKDKIKNYSMMGDRDIEQVTIWGKYLSYAISFGLADKILNRIKGLNLDEDITKIMENVQFMDLIASDYYMFYEDASLDSRFMKEYGRTTGDMFSSMISSSRRIKQHWWRWRIFRRRRIFRRWRKRPVAGGAF